MGSSNDNDFLNSDFPMYAAAGVGLFGVYRALVVSYVGHTCRLSPYWLLQFAYRNQISPTNWPAAVDHEPKASYGNLAKIAACASRLFSGAEWSSLDHCRGLVFPWSKHENAASISGSRAMCLVYRRATRSVPGW